MIFLNNFVLPILFASGFYYIGFIVVNRFKLKTIIEKISNPIYQYCSIGIVFFLFVFYPLIFFGFLKTYFIKYISYSLLFLGLLNFFLNNLSVPLKNFLKEKILNKNYIYLIFVILYFFLSLAPITSGDSLAYHSTVAKHILLYGEFPKNSLTLEYALAGIGEFLNAFAFSINASTFSSFIHFIGLISILGIFDRSLTINNIRHEDKQFIFLLLLSCPILTFLIYSSKPQFFYTSLLIFCFSLLINIRKFKSQIELTKIFIISIIFGIIAVLAKFSFIVVFFLIILNYLFLIKKIFNFYKTLLIAAILLIYLMLPSLIWKQELYNFFFINFLLNPLPINIPGFHELYVHGKNYDSGGFPLSLFIPLSFNSLNIFLGFGCIVIFFLVKEKFDNKKLFLFNIFFFVFVLSFIGLNSPRFYLDIYLFSILIFISVFYKIISSNREV